MRRFVAAGCLVLAVLALIWLAVGRGDAPGAGSAAPAGPSPGVPIAGSAPAPTPTQEQAPRVREDPSLPYTQLPLRLVATVVRENRALSLATVEDLERTGHQVMSEGQRFDAHPQARLLEIERGRVILDNDGVREQLVLDRSDRAPLADAQPAELTPEQREYRRDIARRLREITDAGEDFLDRGERTGLLAEGDVTPVYEDGALVGMRIDDVREGGLYDRHGMRNGDVITAINGISLGSPSAAADVLADLALGGELDVEFQRDPEGPVQRVQVPAEELEDLSP